MEIKTSSEIARGYSNPDTKWVKVDDVLKKLNKLNFQDTYTYTFAINKLSNELSQSNPDVINSVKATNNDKLKVVKSGNDTLINFNKDRVKLK